MLSLPAHITSSGGLGFLDALTLLFAGLKLTGYSDWSWWWVLSPLIATWSLSLIALTAGILWAWWRGRFRFSDIPQCIRQTPVFLRVAVAIVVLVPIMTAILLGVFLT